MSGRMVDSSSIEGAALEALDGAHVEMRECRLHVNCGYYESALLTDGAGSRLIVRDTHVYGGDKAVLVVDNGASCRFTGGLLCAKRIGDESCVAALVGGGASLGISDCMLINSGDAVHVCNGVLKLTGIHDDEDVVVRAKNAMVCCNGPRAPAPCPGPGRAPGRRGVVYVHDDSEDEGTCTPRSTFVTCTDSTFEMRRFRCAGK